MDEFMKRPITAARFLMASRRGGSSLTIIGRGSPPIDPRPS